MEQIMLPEVRQRYEAMLTIAHDLGRLGNKLIRSDEVEIITEFKADGSPVTTIDTTLNQQCIEDIEALYPGDLVWGEEASNSERGDLAAADRNWVWLVDPIDGTRDLDRCLRNKTFFQNTSSFMMAGFAPGETTPTIGVVYEAFNDYPNTVSANPEGTFYQTKRAPRPIQIMWNEQGPQSLAEVKRFEENSHDTAEVDINVLRKIMPYARKIRTGSVGVAVARHALGEIELVAFSSPSNPHDMTPGAVIAHRAGSVVTNLRGEKYDEIDWRREKLAGFLATPNQQLADDFFEHIDTSRLRAA